MPSTPSKIDIQLEKRTKSGNYRSLKLPDTSLIDFCSNDYLGLARDEVLKLNILEEYRVRVSKNGSTGSRLLTGNNILAEQAESFLSNLFGHEKALIFNSGYNANLAFFSCIPQKGDTILYDELAHACIKDGSRLSMAKSMPFKHNDIEDLSRKMTKAVGEIYVACESVYSMDGDFAPLKALARLAKEHGAKLIVDEAHSTGLFGKKGSGLVSELGLASEVYAVIYTFGKAMGIHGACLTSSTNTIQYLVNFSRPFIYTTAPSDFELLSIQKAFAHLAARPGLAIDLAENIQLFKQELLVDKADSPSSQTAIQAIVIGGNEKTRTVANELQKKGFDIRPILSPTVQQGKERLRICLHAFNSKNEVISLAHALNSLLC